MASINIPQEQQEELSIVPAPPVWADVSINLPMVPYDTFVCEFAADGGYLSATIVFNTDRISAEEWFEHGLGRDIKVYSPDGLTVIFNGFVNQITTLMGSLSAVRGPLLGIGNRVRAVYSEIIDTDGNIVGTRETTDAANNTASQSRYGIVEKVLSVGGATTANAELIRDRWLDENSLPVTSEQVAIGSANVPQVTLEILGYVHLLKTFTFTDTTSGTRQLSDRVKDLIAADPSSRFSSNYQHVQENTETIPRLDNDDRLAWQIMKDVSARGDAASNRWIFGMYNNREMYYSQAPTDFEYFHRIQDGRQLIVNYGDNEVKPWMVRPGKWLAVSDWLIGRKVAATATRDDPRALFIERVSYSAPYGVNISGSKLSRLPQLMAKMGLSGASS